MTNNQNQPAVTPQRNYKARLFEMIFREKEELLGLYNAVNKTHYTNPEELEINTLENAIYLSMYNDISFVIASKLSLYEQQSTYNPNLPLRFLMYIADLYSSITAADNLYGTRLIKLPPPRFIIFYNGEEECEERKTLKLSDAYKLKEEDPSLELKAEFININPGKNKELLKACKTLSDYSEYTSRVRKYAKTVEIQEAVERAVRECIQEGILAEFLERYRAEAIAVSIYEYDEERQRRLDREEGMELGMELGMERGMSQQKLEDVKKVIDLLDEEVIAERFGVPIEEIRKLK